MAEKRYVLGDRSGWLRVKLEPSKKIVSLPEYLKVEFADTRSNRDHFKILEGVHKNKLASVVVKSGNGSHLGKPMPTYTEGAKLAVDISKLQLVYKRTTVKITVNSSAKPKVGTHKIQIPDFPHKLGARYLPKSKYALSWFFLGTGTASTSNDRYLHTGQASLGCVTVDTDKWTDLYRLLILSRAGDGRSVGTITIKA